MCQGQVRKTHDTECTNIHGTACARAKQEIVLELFCIPVATTLTEKSTVHTLGTLSRYILAIDERIVCVWWLGGGGGGSVIANARPMASLKH